MDEERLRALWARTLGSAPAEEGLSPGASFRPGLSSRVVPAAEAGTVATGTFLPPPPPPRSQAPYDLGEELGRGGMGVVCRARQNSLGRPVALKRILPGTTDLAARDMFLAEARVTARLDHPNVVPVHDLSVAADGTPFLTMKLVGGTPWSRLLHPKNDEERAHAASLDRDAHLEILASVCNAVACAHSQGIIHRDLKPENVMLGDFGEILVMDWGLAAEFVERAEADRLAPHVSTVDAPAGTPSYMAPELADARGSEQGPWTDVYLLGAILHEILVGEPPHKGGSFFRVLAAASESAPPRFPDSVPAELQGICRRALAASPGDRYPTVASFQGALQAFKRHRESLRISDAAVTALAAARRPGGKPGAAGTSQIYSSYAEALALARQAQVLWAGNEAARHCEVAARAGHARAALEAGDIALARSQADDLPRDTAERPDLEALVAAAEEARSRAVRSGRALKVLVALLVILVGTGTTVFVQQLVAANASLTAARDEENEALRHQQRLRLRAEDFIEAMVNDLSVELNAARRPDLVEKINDKALTYYEGLTTEDLPGGRNDGLPRRLAMLALNEGEAHMARGELDQALAAFEKSARIGLQAKRDDDVTTALLDIGRALEAKGDYEGAREKTRSARDLAKKASDADGRDMWWLAQLEVAHAMLSELELRHGDGAPALEDARAALAVARRLLDATAGSGQWVDQAARAYEAAAAALLAQGDRDGALEMDRAQLALYERLTLPDPSRRGSCWSLVRTHQRIAALLAAKQDAAGALESEKQAADFLVRFRGACPGEANVESNLAAALEACASLEAKLGDRDGARKSLTDAVSILRELADHAPGDGRLKAWLARLEERLSGF
jgi:tetratricopeptide (TPR) repeat protein